MIIHLHGDLPTLLPRVLRGQPRIEAPLSRRSSVKDLIESYDVPHTEVGRLTGSMAGRSTFATSRLIPSALRSIP